MELSQSSKSSSYQHHRHSSSRSKWQTEWWWLGKYGRMVRKWFVHNTRTQRNNCEYHLKIQKTSHLSWFWNKQERLLFMFRWCSTDGTTLAEYRHRSARIVAEIRLEGVSVTITEMINHYNEVYTHTNLHTWTGGSLRLSTSELIADAWLGDNDVFSETSQIQVFSVAQCGECGRVAVNAAHVAYS